MFSPYHQALKFLAIPLLLSLFTPAFCNDEVQQHKVTDLAYGTSLFYLFQDKELNAITEIEVGKERNSLKNQPDDAKLLLGSLYFNYGLADESEKIFNDLLNEDTDQQTKSRVWFNLAKLQYDKSHYQRAEELLSRISEQLSAPREAQKNYMLSNIYINDQQLDKAENATSLIQQESSWSAFSEYNLGVALSKSEQKQSGQAWLLKLISRETEDTELLSLQNAARLVLGLDALRNKEPEKSIQYLANIPVDSAFTNKALLATGWAWSQLSNPAKALTYWLTLVEREQKDTATLEAYLAIGYAYEQLENKPQAILQYEKALQMFDQTLDDLGEAMQSIGNMELINELYSGRSVQPGLNNLLTENLPKHSSTPFLQQLFASKEFQQTLLNYRELLEAHNALLHWKVNLPTLELVLIERINSFESKREVLAKTNDIALLDILLQQRDKLAQEVQRIERDKDYYALANEDELDYLEQLENLTNQFEKLQSRLDLSKEKEKFRIMSGLLQWTISTDYPRRYWSIFHELQLLDRAIEESRKSIASIQQASKVNSVRLNEFKQRIKGQNDEIERMEIAASELIEQQEQVINLQAMAVLEKQLQHINELKLNARYSATRLYDELSKTGSAQ